MAEAEGISAWRSQAIDQLAKARRDHGPGDNNIQDIVAKLRTVHIALGERRTGTSEEQRTYLLARATGTPLPELMAVGLDTNNWPAPPHSSPALAEPQPVSPDTAERIAHLFASVGALNDRPKPRYVTEYRPEDGERYRGQPLPWAIWDTAEDIPVAYHSDKDLADYQAGKASDRLSRRRQS
ncbi:hypothetical protein KUF83_30130 [Streptomyces sp. BV286]|uniref:hypothetical protein n=1 Tax=Streptomyces sp. BV286 TaxID=2849672 RepID=UPI001C2E1EC6|nr:hypothetical protein [Streptomyces sp. BV286]MBV1940795.1 hypothetical protein [Streptomyces sp. BV286]